MPILKHFHWVMCWWQKNKVKVLHITNWYPSEKRSYVVFWVQRYIDSLNKRESFVYQVMEEWQDIPSTDLGTMFMVSMGLKEKFGHIDTEYDFYPAAYFYPFTLVDAYSEVDYESILSDESLAVHLWEKTWIMPEFRHFWFGLQGKGFQRLLAEFCPTPCKENYIINIGYNIHSDG